MASCVARSLSLSPIVSNFLTFSMMAFEMDGRSPIGQPNRVAFLGSTTHAPGRGLIESMVGLLQMISNLDLSTSTPPQHPLVLHFGCQGKYLLPAIIQIEKAQIRFQSRTEVMNGEAE